MSHALAFDELPRGAGGVGATEQIARTLHESGIDAPVSLYDEGLALAREGRLAPSAERLRMLLCLDPSDASASLLLGKVLAARGLWQESLARLDAASAGGAVLPPGLREHVEAELRRKIQDAEAHRARLAAREQGELKNLRSEAKRLRSDNASLDLQVDELTRRVKLWSSATALVAGSASALLLASLLFGGDTTEVPDAPTTTAVEATAGDLTLTPVADDIVMSAQVETADRTPSGALTETTTPASAALSSGVTATGATPPTAASARTHTVKRGDTLGGIANQYYGSSAQWPRIQSANKALLGDGIKLSLGMKLTIPAKD